MSTEDILKNKNDIESQSNYNHACGYEEDKPGKENIENDTKESSNSNESFKTPEKGYIDSIKDSTLTSGTGSTSTSTTVTSIATCSESDQDRPEIPELVKKLNFDNEIEESKRDRNDKSNPKNRQLNQQYQIRGFQEALHIARRDIGEKELLEILKNELGDKFDISAKSFKTEGSLAPTDVTSQAPVSNVMLTASNLVPKGKDTKDTIKSNRNLLVTRGRSRYLFFLGDKSVSLDDIQRFPEHVLNHYKNAGIHPDTENCLEVMWKNIELLISLPEVISFVIGRCSRSTKDSLYSGMRNRYGTKYCLTSRSQSPEEKKKLKAPHNYMVAIGFFKGSFSKFMMKIEPNLQHLAEKSQYKSKHINFGKPGRAPRSKEDTYHTLYIACCIKE